VLAQRHLPEAAADLIAALADLNGHDLTRHADDVLLRPPMMMGCRP
jgi:hypothetical protein